MRTLFVIALILLNVACQTKYEKETQFLEIDDFSSYQNPSSVDGKIQAAARAVVRIGDIGGPMGTGFFFSEEGLLMTNNHIINERNCTLEGCFVTLDIDFQRDIDYNPKAERDFFAKPLATDSDLDFTILQIYSLNGEKSGAGEKYRPEHFAELETRSNKELLNEKLYVIGHPLAQMKKVKSVKAYKAEEKFVFLNDYVFGGNSGSPVVNSEGKVVALLHSGYDHSKTISKNGIQGVSIATATNDLFDEVSLPKGEILSLKATQNSVSKNFLDIDSGEFSFARDSRLLLSLRRLPRQKELKAKQAGEATEAVETLDGFVKGEMKACQENFEVAPEAAMGLRELFYSCQNAMPFINCAAPSDLQICPEPELAASWKALAERVNDISVNQFAAPHTLAVRLAGQLIVDDFERQENAAQKMIEYLTVTEPSLSFGLAAEMIQLGLGDFEGHFQMTPSQFVKNFKLNEFHSQSLHSIASVYINWLNNGVVKSREFTAVMKYIFAHRDITAETQFRLESVMYKGNILKTVQP